MNDFGQCGSKRVKRGRPKKKPNYDREKEIDDLIQQAVTLFEVPYDDRDERSPDAPTIKSVAAAMNTSRVRLKKLLITAGYYSSETSRKVQMLLSQGYTINQIIQETGLSSAGVNAVLPYKRGVYNLEDPPLYSEICKQFRKRKRACEQLIDHLDESDSQKYLWEAIQAFENYSFQMESGKRFKYTIENECLYLEGQTFPRNEIETVFYKIRELKRTGSVIDKKNSQCCDMIYTIFLRIGANSK